MGSEHERYSVAIRELPSEDRPRERLRTYGAQALSTQELLAIVLRTGTVQRSALGLAESILHAHSGLRGVATASLDDLTRTKGIGSVKAIQLAACFELGKRLCALPEQVRPEVSRPDDAVNLLMPDMRHLAVETFRALMLDTRNRLMRVESVTVGTLDSSLAHPREVFRKAVSAGAASIIIAHNHPSGDPTPSPDDRKTTERLKQAGDVLGIELLDHVIIGDGRWVSLRREGLM